MILFGGDGHRPAAVRHLKRGVAGLGFQFSQQKGAGRARDARFVPCDGCQTVAQDGRVIQPHAGEHRQLTVEHVGGVPTPAKTTLHDRQLDARIAEGQQRQRGQQFEVTGLHLIDERLKPVPGDSQRKLVKRLAVHQNPLEGTQQMGRGIQPGAQSGLTQTLFDEGTERALAIGARHMDHTELSLGIVQQLQQAFHALQAGLDPEAHALVDALPDPLNAQWAVRQLGRAHRGVPTAP